LTDVAALAFQRPASTTLSSTDIRDLLTGKKVSLGAGTAGDAVVLSVNGTPDDVEVGFRLAHLLLTEPQTEAPAVKEWKERMAQEIERRRTSVKSQMAEEADALLSSGDIRFKRLTQEQVDGLTLGDGQRWLSRMIRSSPMEVAVVGDIERDRALELVLKYLGSLPERPDVAMAFPELRELHQKPGPLVSTVQVDTITPLAVVLVGWRGADWTAVKERRVLQIAAQIMTTRLREELREELGLAYSPYCSARAGVAYRGAGLLATRLTAKPERAAEMAELARQVMEKLAEEGPTEEEMEAVHKQFGNFIETDQKEPSYWVRVLAELDYHGTVLSDVKEAYEKYTSYTREDVLEVLRKYMTEERRIQVIALPKEPPSEEEDQQAYQHMPAETPGANVLVSAGEGA
jgi:zinc protease